MTLDVRDACDSRLETQALRSSNTSARMSQPSSICSSVRVSAGSRRRTVWCVQLMSRPLLQAGLHDGRAVDGQFDADHRALDAHLA